MDKLKTHSPIYCMMDNWEHMLSLIIWYVSLTYLDIICFHVHVYTMAFDLCYSLGHWWCVMASQVLLRVAGRHHVITWTIVNTSSLSTSDIHSLGILQGKAQWDVFEIYHIWSYSVISAFVEGIAGVPFTLIDSARQILCLWDLTIPKQSWLIAIITWCHHISVDTKNMCIKSN